MSAGNIRSDNVNARSNAAGRQKGERWASLPFYTSNGGMVSRQCTKEYKIAPIEKEIRGLLGLKPRQHWPKERVVTQWYGISIDEIQRCKVEADPAAKWRINRYPLVQKRMSRNDCLRWMERNQYPAPPRSACIGCPFRDNRGWRAMRDTDPASWADAVDFDRKIRNATGMKNQSFIHRSAQPLDEVDLSTLEDHGQMSLLDECEGMCGV